MEDFPNTINTTKFVFSLELKELESFVISTLYAFKNSMFIDEADSIIKNDEVNEKMLNKITQDFHGHFCIYNEEILNKYLEFLAENKELFYKNQERR